MLILRKDVQLAALKHIVDVLPDVGALRGQLHDLDHFLHRLGRQRKRQGLFLLDIVQSNVATLTPEDNSCRVD